MKLARQPVVAAAVVAAVVACRANTWGGLAVSVVGTSTVYTDLPVELRLRSHFDTEFDVLPDDGDWYIQLCSQSMEVLSPGLGEDLPVLTVRGYRANDPDGEGGWEQSFTWEQGDTGAETGDPGAFEGGCVRISLRDSALSPPPEGDVVFELSLTGADAVAIEWVAYSGAGGTLGFCERQPDVTVTLELVE